MLDNSIFNTFGKVDITQLINIFFLVDQEPCTD